MNVDASTLTTPLHLPCYDSVACLVKITNIRKHRARVGHQMRHIPQQVQSTNSALPYSCPAERSNTLPSSFERAFFIGIKGISTNRRRLHSLRSTEPWNGPELGASRCNFSAQRERKKERKDIPSF